MRQKEIRVFGIAAPPPRVTLWALGLIASALSLPVAIILWGIEACLR